MLYGYIFLRNLNSYWYLYVIYMVYGTCLYGIYIITNLECKYIFLKSFFKSYCKKRLTVILLNC